MKQKSRLPTRIIRAVEIESVRLVDTIAKNKISSPADIGEAEFVVGDYARVAKHDKEAGIFVVVANVEARVVRKGLTAGRPLVLVRASYELTYSLPKEIKVSRRTLSAFAKTNGVFNAWPYWRELIQSMFARMDLPQPTLPVYLINSSPAEKSRAKEREDRGTDPRSATQLQEAIRGGGR